MESRARSVVAGFTLMLLATFVSACKVQTNAEAASPRAAPGDAVAPAAQARIPVGGEDPALGSPTAYVTLVVFIDLQSPPCAALDTMLAKVRQSYGDDAVRIVWKHAPSAAHASAKLAATVGHGVFAEKGAQAYFRYQDAAWQNQAGLNPDAIRQSALKAGLSASQLGAGLEQGAWATKVEGDMDLAKRLGVDAPSAFANGAAIENVATLAVWKDVIEVELAKARALEQGGIARADVYREAVAANLDEKGGRASPQSESEIDNPRLIWKVPVGTSPVRGKSNALVTVVEFSDFDCAGCKRAQETLDRIRSEYGEKVRIVWKDAPASGHSRAVPAAHLARAARAQKGDAGFWDMHDRLFATTRLDDLELETLARAAGLDVRTAMAAFKSEQARRDIEHDTELVEDVEGSGIPHFFVNGRRLVGVAPFERWKRLVDDEIRKASELVRSGIAPTALYDWVIKDGLPGEPPQKNILPSPSAPFKGAEGAPVTIQQFTNVRCAECKRTMPILEEIARAYPGKIRIVWRDLPSASQADVWLAAEAAREVLAQKGVDAFWKFEERLEKSPSLDRPALEAQAVALGLDLDRLRKALGDRVHRATVQAEVSAATEAGINAAPGLLVGPYFLSGTPGFTKIRKCVERVLANPALSRAMPANAVPRNPVSSSSQQLAPAMSSNGAKFTVVDTRPGTGRAVKNGDTALVHYTGHLADGREFDSSRKRGQPVAIAVGSGMVIRGWEMGLVGMKIGGRRRVTIPPELGYGNHGEGKNIPPNATLILNIELVSIQ
jgi:protein-disulfide isomerase